MPDLLIELFSEEIPARMQARAADDFKKRMTDGLVEAGLTYQGREERDNADGSRDCRFFFSRP